MPDQPHETTKEYCNTCLVETNHKVVATRRKSSEASDSPGIEWIDTYQILECCGCETVCFRLEEYFSEAVDVDDSGTRTTRYPPPTKRRKPKWTHALPRSLWILLEEVYSACALDGRTLAAMGIRAIIDEVANDKVGDEGSFKRKLDLLSAGEFLSSDQADVLDAAFDAGSASMHRAYHPSAEILDHLLDITEHLLQNSYVLRDLATKLRQTTPKKPGKS